MHLRPRHRDSPRRRGNSVSENVTDYTAGRSLMAEMVDLREQMKALKTAMLDLVDLQRDMHTKLDAVLNIRNSAVEETHASQN